MTVFVGGGLGSTLRFAIQLLMNERIVASHFPWTTFFVNVVGSFMIGLFYGLCSRFNLPDDLRLFLTVGLCGGFTTFSTFSNDIIAMIRQGDGLICAVYIVVCIVLGITACLIGGWICTPKVS